MSPYKHIYGRNYDHSYFIPIKKTLEFYNFKHLYCSYALHWFLFVFDENTATNYANTLKPIGQHTTDMYNGPESIRCALSKIYNKSCL